MLMIRLQRVGRRNDPSFRVVVTDKRYASQSGKFVEVLGAYDARQGRPQLNSERIKYWLSVGAQTSATVHNLLVGAKLRPGPKINAFSKKSKKPVASGA